MREAVQRVIQAETEAKAVVARAQAEAERLLAEARREADDCIATVTEEARREAAGIVDAAVREAEVSRNTRLGEETAALEQSVRLDEALKERLVAAAIRCVCAAS